MSVEVCQIALLHSVLAEVVSPTVVEVAQLQKPEIEIEIEEEDEQKQMLDIWSSIQKNNENIMVAPPASLYVHPLVRQSSSLMSQNSLEICTESLGSETGSYELSGDELDSPFRDEAEDEEEEVEEAEEEEERKDLSNVNYHCSIGRRSPARSFPPPLPSISRRDGFCFKMQPHRHNGRLVLESVPVPSHNYLHAERHGGRLLLSFIETAGQINSPAPTIIELQSEKENGEEEEEVLWETEEEEVVMEAEEEEEEEEEEVEVVDRGTIVEVKVSTQPQAANGAGMLKVLRSSLVINKFIVGSPLPVQGSPHMKGKRTILSTTTAAAAAMTAASSNMSSPNKENYLQQQQQLQLQQHGSRWVPLSPAAAASSDSKLLFTSKRRSRDELLHDMRRCSELRRLLFIFEQPYCIATS